MNVSASAIERMHWDALINGSISLDSLTDLKDAIQERYNIFLHRVLKADSIDQLDKDRQEYAYCLDFECVLSALELKIDKLSDLVAELTAFDFRGII